MQDLTAQDLLMTGQIFAWLVTLTGENICVISSPKQPWLCINQIDIDNTDDDKLINDIRRTLYKTHDNTGNKIRIDALHRKYKGPSPTSLLLFKTHTATGQDHLLNNDIQHDQLKTRLYINKTQLQCTNCHKLGHTNKHCRNKQSCVRCGGGG